jgi:acyl carrier protein
MWKVKPDGPREIERRLMTFIVEELLEEPYDGPDPLADEAVDSLGQEQLAEYVDEVYGVELTDDDMVRENFESVAALAALVRSKLRDE